MRFKVPVMFNAEVVHKGKRKAVSETMAEWLDLQVEVIDSRDAPLATEWTDGSGVAMRTRWHNGCHWKEQRVRDGDGDDHGSLTVRSMAEMSATGTKHGNPLAVGIERVLQEFAEGKLPAFDAGAFRQVVKSDRDDAIAKAERQAADTIVVDGTVWVRSSEPVYVLERRHLSVTGEGRCMVSPEVMPIASVEPKTLDKVFRADRFEDMEAEAKTRFGEQVEADTGRRISVYFPDSIRHDDEKSAFFTGIETLLESKRKFLPTSPLHEIRPWLELAECLAHARKDWNEENAAALETAADTYAATVLSADTWYAEKMGHVLARWRMRPIEAGHDGAAVQAFR